jgi:microcystin-dependent protein
MSEPFIAEIRCFGFNFAPIGWAKCNGQLLSIAQNNALYAIIGTTYGGDGQTTFALPNLQGQIPMHWGNGSGGFNTVIGEVQGVTDVTLLTSQLPQHTHTVTVVSYPAGGGSERTAVPNNQSFLSSSQAPDAVYQTAPTSVTAAFSPKAISPVGGSQPHDNMQPYLALNFCIALEGIFPSRN